MVSEIMDPRSYLEPVPSVVPGYIENSENMPLLGYLPVCASGMAKEFYRGSQRFDLPPPPCDFDPNSYVWVLSHPESLRRSALRFDHPEQVSPLIEPHAAESVRSVVNYLVDCGFRSCPVLPSDRIEVVPSSSAGYPGRVCRKWGVLTSRGSEVRTKGDLLSTCPWLPDFVWDHGWFLLKDPMFYFSAKCTWRDVWDLYKRLPIADMCAQIGKNEYLALSKVQNGKFRTIMVPVLFHFASARLNQFFNKEIIRLGNDFDFAGAVGVVFAKGGFERLGRELSGFSTVIDHDCTLWDSNEGLRLRQLAALVRIAMWDGKGMSRLEFLSRMVFFTLNSVVTMFYLPNGQVFLKTVGGSSGHLNTTSDNTIDHLLMMHISWKILTGMDLFYDQLPTGLVAWRNHFWFKLYADDSVKAYRPMQFPAHTIRFLLDNDLGMDPMSYEVWKYLYSLFGQVLKPQTHHGPLDASPGITFLGYRFVQQWRVGLKVWVPEYDRQRALTAVVLSKTRLHKANLGKRLMTAFNLMVITTFDDSLSEYFRLVYMTLQRSNSKFSVPNFRMAGLGNVFPTHDDLIIFWLGLECTGGDRPVRPIIKEVLKYVHENSKVETHEQEHEEGDQEGGEKGGEERCEEGRQEGCSQEEHSTQTQASDPWSREEGEGSYQGDRKACLGTFDVGQFHHSW